MSTCDGKIVGYQSPWDREHRVPPHDLICQLEAGHHGYHRDQFGMAFGPWSADDPTPLSERPLATTAPAPSLVEENQTNE